jgi:hypothetical protein
MGRRITTPIAFMFRTISQKNALNRLGSQFGPLMR